MIPKTLHLVNFFQELPQYATLNIAEWRKLMPDYRIELHTDPNKLPEKWKALFDSTNSVCVKCDIARYAIIWEHGGYYADLDMTPIKTMNLPCSFSGVWGTIETDIDHKQSCPDSAFFGAVAKDSLLSKVLSSIKIDDNENCLQTSAYFHLSRVVRKELKLYKVPYNIKTAEYIKPNYLFLPLLFSGANSYGKYRHMTPEELKTQSLTSFIHHAYKGSWCGQILPNQEKQGTENQWQI